MMFARTIPVVMQLSDGPRVRFEVKRLTRVEAGRVAAAMQGASIAGQVDLAVRTVAEHLVNVSSTDAQKELPDVSTMDDAQKHEFVDYLPDEIAGALFAALLNDGDPDRPKWTAGP